MAPKAKKAKVPTGGKGWAGVCSHAPVCWWHYGKTGRIVCGFIVDGCDYKHKYPANAEVAFLLSLAVLVYGCPPWLTLMPCGWFVGYLA